MPFNLKNGKGLFTKSILILLAFTFVIGFGYVGGVSIGGGGPSGGTAIEINGQKVSFSQFYSLRDSFYRQYQEQISLMPDNASDFVNRAVLNIIIELKILSQKAKELGLQVSDEELSDAIRNDPSFQIDGVFVGSERYNNFITNRLNQSVGEFERNYKDEILAKKLIDLVNESAKVTEEELLNLYRIQNEEINLFYVSFSPKDYISSVVPTDDEIKVYYNNNKKNFLTDEKRKAKYLRLTTKNFEKKVKVSGEELKAYYNAYKDEFKIGEEIRGFNVVKSEIESKLKKTKALVFYDEFLGGLRSGKGFQSLEKLASEYPSTKVINTDYFSSTDLQEDIPFEVKNKAFTVGKGKLAYESTSDSLWFIEVVDIKSREQKSLEKVRGKVVNILKNQKAKDKARAAANESLRKLENSGQKFGERASSLNLKVKETGFFDRVRPPSGISDEDLIFDAFQLNTENRVSSKVYNLGNILYIVALKKKKPINMDDFEQKKMLIKQQEVARHQNEIIADWIDEIRSASKIVPNQGLF